MSILDSQRVVKNTIYLFIRMIFVLLVGLYTSRVVLNVLGVEDFGIYNIVGSVVVFLSFLKMALTNATYRYLAVEIAKGDNHKLNEVYSMSINCHLLLAVFVFICLELGGVWFLNNKLNIPEVRMYAANRVFQFSVLSFCIGIIQTPFNSNIIAHERMNFYAVISVIEVLLKLFVVFALIRITYDKLISYACLHLLVAIVIFVSYLLFCIYKISYCRYIMIWDNKLGKELISYSGWSLVVNASDVVAWQSMSIFLNIFSGVVANAAMGITQQVTSQLGAFLNNFTQAFNPQIIKSYAAKEYSYFMKLIFSTSKISYLMFLFVSLPVVANIEFILTVWLGEYPAITPTFIRILIFYNIIESTQYPFLNAVHATGRIKVHQILMSSIKLASIPLMYYVLKIGSPDYYILLIWVIFTLIWCVVRTVYMHFLIGLSLKQYLKEVIIKIIVITSICVPVTLWIVDQINNPVYAFGVSSSFSVVAMSLLIWFYALNSSEKSIILNMRLVQAIINKFKSNEQS